MSTPGGGIFDELVSWLGVPTDPWASVPAPVHHRLFGAGSRRPFAWYFTGPLRAGVRTVSEMQEWLLGCLYVSDEQLHGSADYWQHPGVFEQVRMGDCDDHALWAWRKLVELGYPTSLVAGRWEEEPDGLHTWLVTRIDGERHIVEATSKVLATMILPFETAAPRYRPFVSVDERFCTRAYLGGFHHALGFEARGSRES